MIIYMLALYKLRSTLQDKELKILLVDPIPFQALISYCRRSKSIALDHTSFALVNSFFRLVFRFLGFFFQEKRKKKAILNNKKTIFS